MDKITEAVSKATSATVGAVTDVTSATAGAVSKAASATVGAVSDVSSATVGAVSTVTSATVGAITTATGAATNMVTSSLQLFNIKEILLGMLREYIVILLLNEEKEKLKDKAVNNFSLALTVLTIAPVERCRILLKTQHLLGRKYIGAFDCFFSELRKNGLRTVFRGAIPVTSYHLYYYNLLDFRVKTFYKALQDKKQPFYLTLGKVFCYDFGIMLGAQPIESIASRIAVTKYKEVTLWESLKQYRTLFNGFSANLLLLMTNYSILVPSLYYISMKSFDQLELFGYLLGSMALSESMSYPFELIKSRYMIQGHNDCEIKYFKLRDTIKQIYLEEHLNGFYKGGMMKVVNYGLRRGLFIGISGYISKFFN
jgi:hypothetical protein